MRVLFYPIAVLKPGSERVRLFLVQVSRHLIILGTGKSSFDLNHYNVSIINSMLSVNVLCCTCLKLVGIFD
jgi:hypothetical protein